jgi:PIN domain nuclease of toxin-antitoxin system
LKLLLDTHIWIWSLTETNRLSRIVKREVNDQNNELWLSPVSTWEFLHLFSRGRINVAGNPREWVMKACGYMREAPLTHEIVFAAQELPLPHRDPADRFLAATASVLGLTLVTSDRRLLGLKNIATLANR